MKKDQFKQQIPQHSSGTPKASRIEKTLPFGTDENLRESHINIFGDLRFGKLLEEMDMTAGKVAYQHTNGFDLDLTIVTAACDRIDLLGRIPSDSDLRISGQMNWVGRSSMEVGIRLESKIDGTFRMVARAYFIMVALKEGRGYPVSSLAPESKDEHRRFKDAQLRQEQRKNTPQRHYQENAPSAEESQLLHRLFKQIREHSIEGVMMGDTFRQTTLLMHPQDRNIHHKIFGGYIMHQSFQLGWTIAYLFCGRRPLFVAVDRIYFYEPVEIGSVVCFNGVVVYSGRTSFVVEVKAEVIDPRSSFSKVTNVAYLTFVAIDSELKPVPVPTILPHTYDEGLKYLEGARCYQIGKQLLSRKENRSAPSD